MKFVFPKFTYCSEKFTVHNMTKNVSALLALLGWIAVITQYVLLIDNRTVPVMESTIRFFSYFTILTNALVAVYFTVLFFSKHIPYFIKSNPGLLTAITVYITLVGLVYQVVLRQVWEPQGIQMIVDELLHTIIPLLVIVFWALYETSIAIQYSKILLWSVYPLVYLVGILIRGSFSGYYPYPFVDVNSLGLTHTLLNAALLLVLFSMMATVFIFVGKKVIRR
ncbi:Pr6Pr family membrane protein [soil metagenome]